MRLLLYPCAYREVALVSTCAIVTNKPSLMPRRAYDTGRVGVKSSALRGSVRGAAAAAAESSVQITSVVSGFAHESCISAAVSHASAFASNTFSARATVRRTPNC